MTTFTSILQLEEKPSVTPEAYQENALMLLGSAYAVRETNPELSELLRHSAQQLWNASEHICAQGYFGCRAGKTCISDHK